MLAEDVLVEGKRVCIDIADVMLLRYLLALD